MSDESVSKKKKSYALKRHKEKGKKKKIIALGCATTETSLTGEQIDTTERIHCVR
jgi:hypothetical protein